MPPPPCRPGVGRSWPWAFPLVADRSWKHPGAQWKRPCTGLSAASHLAHRVPQHRCKGFPARCSNGHASQTRPQARRAHRRAEGGGRRHSCPYFPLLFLCSEPGNPTDPIQPNGQCLRPPVLPPPATAHAPPTALPTALPPGSQLAEWAAPYTGLSQAGTGMAIVLALLVAMGPVCERLGGGHPALYNPANNGFVWATGSGTAREHIVRSVSCHRRPGGHGFIAAHAGAGRFLQATGCTSCRRWLSASVALCCAGVSRPLRAQRGFNVRRLRRPVGPWEACCWREHCCPPPGPSEEGLGCTAWFRHAVAHKCRVESGVLLLAAAARCHPQQP